MLGICLLALAGAAGGKDFAFVVRTTDLKAQPFSDAATTAQLAEKQKVEVLARKVSWTQIKADTATGWVKMLSLRFDNPDTAPKSDGGIKAAFNLVNTGSSGSTVTTGARGLDEKKLSNPTPNTQAFDIMRNYAVNADNAQKFAKKEKLEAQNLAYVDAKGEKK
jgi:hypothetical protein